MFLFFYFAFLSDLSIESLYYLSSEQALADLAYFIELKNKENSFDKNVKWIAFGGSYPGSLAAWLREKYSDLVYGSISTSGPLLAKADFSGKHSFYSCGGCFSINLDNSSLKSSASVRCKWWAALMVNHSNFGFDFVKNSIVFKHFSFPSKYGEFFAFMNRCGAVMRLISAKYISSEKCPKSWYFKRKSRVK